MINIVSTQADKFHLTGPYKVFNNLIKGLDRIGYPYVINRDLNATKRLWIHDDLRALKYMNTSRAYTLLGPNLVVMPHEIPKGIEIKKALYLQPSDWVVKWWKHIGFKECPLKSWPVGIDTDDFKPSNIPQSKRRILVYHKKRDPQELLFLLKALQEMNLPYWLVHYGSYDEKGYRAILSRTSFIIWHGCHESQGLALQEALACNIPILVCDAVTFGYAVNDYPIPDEYSSFPTTTAPYFDNTCGLKISDVKNLRTAIEEMSDNFDTYTPRDFIHNNLSIEKQSKEFVRMWEHWDLTMEEGYYEKCLIRKRCFIPEDVTLKKRIRNIAKKLFPNANKAVTLEAIEQKIIKLLTNVLDKPLSHPTAREKELSEALKKTFRTLPITEAKDLPSSQATWIKNIKRIRELVLNDDPKKFLRWDVIQNTMFVAYNRYITKELKYLKSLHDWHSRWCKAIKESSIGHPLPYPFYPGSSCNLIHHAYHLAQFEEKTKTRADEIKYVFEFGGGYGSMCRLFHNLGFRGKYAILDLPHFSALQQFFLKSIGIVVHSIDEFKAANKGVICISDLEELRILLLDIDEKYNSMFIATWSISETPISLRNSILPLVIQFGAFLIAYQHQFEEVNNLNFFSRWEENFNNQVVWHKWHIEHMPGNSYLVGKRLKTDILS